MIPTVGNVNIVDITSDVRRYNEWQETDLVYQSLNVVILRLYAMTVLLCYCWVGLYESRQ